MRFREPADSSRVSPPLRGLSPQGLRTRSSSPQRLPRSPSSPHSNSPTSPPSPSFIRSRSSSPSQIKAPPSGPRHRGKPPRSTLIPLRSEHPPLISCRSVYNYTRLNHIEEGTYGVVFRAKCNDTGEIYALKKLKLEEEKQGFPITSLREVMALMVAGSHENVVGIREIVVGDTLNQIFIVMPFIEHDLKTLLADMPHPFLQSEVKTIMMQLLSAVAHCHANWILHRDLKTSNLLMNNRGQIKVADFGLARKFGDPLGEMTQLVVTLWYRSPELLLGAKEYTTAVDIWSCGCIFAELMQGQALFPGKGEIDQISKASQQIFTLLGQPNDDVWPGYSSLPLTRKINPVGPAFSSLRQKFKHLSSEGHNLLTRLLLYDPDRRVSAEEAGKHAYFTENPLPKHSDLFPSFPSQAAGERRHKSLVSPSAPIRLNHDASDLADLDSFV
ncbi:putative cell division cycle 2 [Kockovaella imperatae]|uniref:cyclin-dependent kinase n=1 Tax=Kockovaella imperatae TaxID=4999 RepID=A0A1Y1UAE7_9TREE|nr:putative cell division cycle 2 [Kockovaella imperatae]ORX35008.1 putative cell division cycle 2 [Kockovaella imperatae]